MKILTANPPNFDSILRVFPEAASTGVLFCYGDTIFNPSGVHVPPQLIAHEEVHSSHQFEVSPDTWWELYLSDPEWRLSEELDAHRVEYEKFKGLSKSRNERRLYLHQIAKRLSGPLYNHMLTLERAKALIKDASLPTV